MMKKNILVIAIIFSTSLIGMFSCSRDYTLKSPVSTTTGSSYLRVIDASPNFRSIFNLPDSFNVFVNGTKISGFTPGATYLMTYGASFPAVTSLNGYVAVNPGTQVIKLTLGGVLNSDSIAITNFTKTLLPDQCYTLMITDSILSTRDSSQIFVQDIYTKPTIGYYNLRFIHAVLNDTAGKAIDVWSTRNNKNIFTNLKPGSVSSFIPLPYNVLLGDTLYVRRAGSLTNTLATGYTLISFMNQRTFTLYYKGDGNLTTGTRARGLAVYVNQ
jgi:hypothetical protein